MRQPWGHGVKGEPAAGQCLGGFGGQPKMVGPAADTSLGMLKGMGMSSGMEDACCECSDASLTHQVEGGDWGCAVTLDGLGVAWRLASILEPRWHAQGYGATVQHEHCARRHTLGLDRK